MNKSKSTAAYSTGFSLQSQYLFFALILGIIITISIFLSYKDMEERYQLLIANSRHTSEIRSEILELRNHIKALSNGIDVVMLEPEYLDQVKLIFQASFTESAQIISRLIKNTLYERLDISSELNELSGKVNELYDISFELFEIRVNANKQYPSMEISSVVMRPARNIIFTTLNTGISEFESEAYLNRRSPYFELLLHAKQMWTNTIAEYRLYLANRVGSFNEEQLFDQEVIVENFIQNMTEIINRLQNYKEDFGFESSVRIPKLPDALEEWKNGFMKVKEIHHSQSWRKDTDLMRVSILPLLDVISNYMVDIDGRIEDHNYDLMVDFAELGQWQTTLLIIIASVFIAYSLITFVFLKYLIFKPVVTLSGLLRSGDIDSDSIELRKLGKTKETKVLIDSFIAMHGQVIKRQEDLSHQALHDSLTSLPNRKLLKERLHHAMQIADREGSSLSFIMLDLNGFKYVNDTLGHHVGDQLLVKVGERLKSILRDVDTIARLGGDEFSIILPGAERNDASIVASKIHETLEVDFKVGDCVLHVGTSIGITEYPQDGENVHDLMKHADIAMYKSKKGKTDYDFYDPKDNNHSIQRLSLTSDLRNAIENNLIELNYQPKLAVTSDELVGYEVLLRWDHESCGYIPPEQIIEIAENAALIDDLTALIFENAVKDSLLLSESNPGAKLAVNLSVHNLRNDAFFENVKNIIAQYDIEAGKIIFELTEGSMMADPEKSIDMLNRLTGLGVSISVDDFGTGFSSLAYLKKLPVSELKIDRSFVKDIINDSNDSVIVKSTIELAHNLGLTVVAEGVENEEIYDYLCSMNCDICQGYHFSKPLKILDFVDWLDSR